MSGWLPLVIWVLFVGLVTNRAHRVRMPLPRRDRGEDEKLAIGSPWTQAARQLGIEQKGAHRIAGLIGEISVEVWLDASASRLRCRAESAEKSSPRAIARDLKIAARPSLGRDEASSVLTRDPAFDNCVQVRGDARITHAILCQETRAKLLFGVQRYTLRVEDGSINGSGPTGGAPTIVDLAFKLSAIAKRLQLTSEEVDERLLVNLAVEKIERVSERSLALIERAETRQLAVETGLESANAAFRLCAAKEAGVRGVPVLRALFGSRTLPRGLRRSALRSLLRMLEAPEANETALNVAIADPVLRREAIAFLIERGDRAAVPELIRELETADDPTEHRLATDIREITRALVRIADQESEPRLLELLGAEQSRVRLAAIQVLCRIGTHAAVPHLEAMANAWLADGLVKRAARDAVDTIRARLESGGGLLSLAEVDGALALAENAGALSVREENDL
jgi:hypothetical protein